MHCRCVSVDAGVAAVPSAPAVLLAACLHQQWTGGPEKLAQLQQQNHHHPRPVRSRPLMCLWLTEG